MNFASLLLGFVVADAAGVDRQRALEVGLVAGVGNVPPVPATLLSMVLARSFVGSDSPPPPTLVAGVPSSVNAPPPNIPGLARFPDFSQVAPPPPQNGGTTTTAASAGTTAIGPAPLVPDGPAPVAAPAPNDGPPPSKYRARDTRNSKTDDA